MCPILKGSEMLTCKIAVKHRPMGILPNSNSPWLAQVCNGKRSGNEDQDWAGFVFSRNVVLGFIYIIHSTHAPYSICWCKDETWYIITVYHCKGSSIDKFTGRNAKKFYKKKDAPGRAPVRTRGRDDGNEETEPDAKRPRKSSGAKPKAKSASKANKKK